MKLSIFLRKPRPTGNFSLELVVRGILQNLGPEFEARVAVCRFLSNGFFRRAYNMVEAAFRQGDVNHVTGDVHYITFFLNKQRTVLTIHDCGPLEGEMDVRKRVLKLLWFTIPAHRCAVITVVSNAVKRDLLGHVDIPPDKVVVIPDAVPSMYRPEARPFHRACPVILQIGTAPNKNLPRVFEALKGLPCRLDIVGRLSDEYRALLKHNAIEYRSYVNLSDEEMLARYVECDLVSFASTFEGFGMPIIEANLVGRAVVTSTVASMPEVASDAACLVDPFDIASIRAGFQRVISDTDYRERLVQNGFQNAKRYDARNITRQYEAVYRRVYDASRR